MTLNTLRIRSPNSTGSDIKKWRRIGVRDMSNALVTSRVYRSKRNALEARSHWLKISLVESNDLGSFYPSTSDDWWVHHFYEIRVLRSFLSWHKTKMNDNLALLDSVSSASLGIMSNCPQWAILFSHICWNVRLWSSSIKIQICYKLHSKLCRMIDYKLW